MNTFYFPDFDLKLFLQLTGKRVIKRPSSLPSRDDLLAQRATMRANEASFQQVFGENCGTISGVNRIVGGEDTDISQAPWQVYFQPGLSATWAFQCGGTIISPFWVVSAAHCTNWGVAAQYSSIIHGLTTVAAGTVEQADVPADHWKDVKTIVRHEDYCTEIETQISGVKKL